jgi:rRNA processing protein Krr1/Pno1
VATKSNTHQRIKDSLAGPNGEQKAIKLSAAAEVSMSVGRKVIAGEPIGITTATRIVAWMTAQGLSPTDSDLAQLMRGKFG